MKCINLLKIFAISFLVVLKNQAFDWEFYLSKHKDLRESGIKTYSQALSHFLNFGISELRNCTSVNFDNTNFDWEYYVKVNDLKINSEQEALRHYQQIGYFQKLKYCKPLNIIVCLHIDNIRLIDNYIQQINKFMSLNDQNNYFIKVTFPINKNNIYGLDNNIAKVDLKNIDIEKLIHKSDPYNRNLINSSNLNLLLKIYKYIKNTLNLNNNQIQILFCDNQDDSLGFLMSLDQIVKQDLKHDYLIKIYTQENEMLGKLNSSFLSVRINKLLNKYNCVYSNIYKSKKNYLDLQRIMQNLSKSNSEIEEFNFPKGNMFIVSNKFTDFLKNNNIFKSYDFLEADDLKIKYKKLFGYLFDYLKLDKFILGFYEIPYQYDDKPVYQKISKLKINDIRTKIENNNIKLMAIYFPQFNEIEENNLFWGKGFTEWSLINKYNGEIKKPHLDIGQYNMLDYFTRKKQAIIAKEYGINAFCYYHYWFKDKKVMYEGIEKILFDNEPNLPFVLCWANESWTRNWDGQEQEVLINQDYGNKQDWVDHYNYLSTFFNHPNYIKQDNSPIIYIYRIEHLIKNNCQKMLKVWKKLAKKQGFKDLKIVSILGVFDNSFKSEYIDGYSEHQPNFAGKLGIAKWIFNQGLINFYDIKSTYDNISKIDKIELNYNKGLFYSWDNQSRRINKRANRFINLNYKYLEEMLIKTIENISNNPNLGINYILINSWNEWSEQAMIEPNDHDNYNILKIFKKYFYSLN